jgi:hypothetical protein
LVLSGLQTPPQTRPDWPLPSSEGPDVRLPSGKSQRQEILKADFEKSKVEAGELVSLTQQLKEELEKGEHQVLNLRTLKKVEEIEKLARRIKERMRRFH